MIKFLKLIKAVAPDSIYLTYNLASPYDVADAINYDLTSTPGAYTQVDDDNIPNPIFVKWFNTLLRKRGGYYTFSPYIDISSDEDSDETRYKMFLVSLFQTYGDLYEEFNYKYQLQEKLKNAIKNADLTDLIDDVVEQDDSTNATNELLPDPLKETESPSNKNVNTFKSVRISKNNYLKLIQLIDLSPDVCNVFINRFNNFFNITNIGD